MSTDFRALCAELILRWDVDGCDWKPQHQAQWEAALSRARALLEADGPVAAAVQPTDEEWAALVERAWDKYETFNGQGEPFMYGADFGNALDFVRRELARWGNLKAGLTSSPAEGEAECPGCEGLPTGHNNPCGVCGHFAQPAPPAEGEVTGVMDAIADCLQADAPSSTILDRIAALLERQAAPVPVPVAESTDEALAAFTAYFCRNYPGPDTVIYRPEWHAPKLFRAVVDAIRRCGSPASSLPLPAQDGEVE